jgi:hypothetical protein
MATVPSRHSAASRHGSGQCGRLEQLLQNLCSNNKNINEATSFQKMSVYMPKALLMFCSKLDCAATWLIDTELLVLWL